MKHLGKIAVCALMAGGAALIAATPAAARVSVGIGIGVPGPGYYDGYYNSPCADPEFRYWNPRYCGYPAYYGPVFWGGTWYSGREWRAHYRGGYWHGGHSWHGGNHHGHHGHH